MGNISSEYLTEAEFDAYCDEIIDGKTTTKASIAINKNRQNIQKWLSSYATQEQRDKYARACEMSADAIAEMGFEAAFDDSLDVGFNDEGKPFVRGENIQRSRLKWDACRFEASKRNSKKYGDSTTLKGDKENPVVVQTVDATKLSEQVMAEILNAAAKTDQ